MSFRKMFFIWTLNHLNNGYGSFASWKIEQLNLFYFFIYLFFAFVVSGNTVYKNFSVIIFIYVFCLLIHLHILCINAFLYLYIHFWDSRTIVTAPQRCSLLLPTLVVLIWDLIQLSSKNSWHLCIFWHMYRHIREFSSGLIGWQLNFLFLTYFFHTAAWIAVPQANPCFIFSYSFILYKMYPSSHKDRTSMLFL